MFNYKSRETKSINDTIIFAFEDDSQGEVSSNTQMSFGISNLKDADNKDINTIQRNLYILKNSILQDNNYTDDICTYNTKDQNTIITNYGNILCGKEYLILSPTLQSTTLEDGNVELSSDTFSWSFYIQNDNAPKESSKIYKNNKTYERIPTAQCELTPILIEDICFNKSGALFTSEAHPILVENDSEQFILCADYEITVKNQNGLGFSTILLMENNKVIGTQYTNLITNDRTRFIISNKGRNFSIATKGEDDAFSSSVTYLFNEEFIADSDGKVSIRFSTNSQNIGNLTANF